MKREIFFLFFVLLFANLISAGYSCSGEETSEKKTIKIGEIEAINKLKIALIDTSGISLSADILIDSVSVTLENNESKKINLKKGDYDIRIINLTEKLVSIEVEDDEEAIELDEINGIGGLQVYVKSMGGTYPGTDANVELLVGTKNLFFYKNNLEDIETVDNVRYLIEFLASDVNSAFFEVSACQGGSFIKVADEPEPIINDSNESVNISKTNESLEESNTIIENKDDLENKEEIKDNSTIKNKVEKGINYFMYFLIFIIILIIILIIWFFKNKPG